MAPDQFWALKYDHLGDTDVVFAGDSRVDRGLSPKAVNKELPGSRTLNYGWSAVGYETRYLNAIDRVLDKHSGCPMVVLGIAPNNFIESRTRVNDFLELDKKNAFSIWLGKYFGSVAHFTRPVSASERKCMIGDPRARKTTFLRVYHDDGWMESRIIPEDPTERLPSSTQLTKREPAKPEIINGLLTQVAKWRRRGIKVYGLRYPTSSAMRDMEDKYGHLDIPEFSRRFADAGGVWINVPIEGYTTYDGSHLRADSAIKLSRYVGKYIAMNLRIAADKAIQ
ncbi:MAG: hypothetical protein ACYC1M_04745 [Armatimonadota bacterium]